MKHLYQYNLLRTVRNKGDMFFSLLFPILLGALFYLSFGNQGTETMMAPVPAAVVKEGNLPFEAFLNAMDGETIDLRELPEQEALLALETDEVDGIFYTGSTPNLTVSSTDIHSSILHFLLKAYLENQTMLEEISQEHPAGLPAAILAITNYKELTLSADMDGNAINDTLTYYFALVSMACLFGAFSGLTVSSQLRADQSALAARRSISPTHRFKLVFSEMTAVFTVQFLNLMLLLLYLHFILHIDFGRKWPLLLPVCMLGSMTGVAMGIFIGCSRLPENIKTGSLVGISLTMCFLSDLMVSGIKNSIEHHAPFLNRINPAVLISDSFYCITVYDNPERYLRNLILLALITAALVITSYYMLRRERYDSL